MSEDSIGWISIMVVVLVVIAGITSLGYQIGKKDATQEFQQQAIENGAAEFDAKTGEWKWKEPKQ